MAYERLNLVNKVDKWKAEYVSHLEDGIIDLENKVNNTTLPKVDESDNGKVLGVVNGTWSAVDAPEEEEYDGNVTIKKGVSLISFTISNTEYEAEEDMTWAEWCESGYNTSGYYIDGTRVKTIDGRGNVWITNDGVGVREAASTDVITSGSTYSTVRSSSPTPV